MQLTIELKVIPHSGRQRLVLNKHGLLTCYLKAPPTQGKANDELIALLSKKLKIAKNKIVIALGATGRKKIIKIETTHSFEQIIALLEIETQQSLF